MFPLALGLLSGLTWGAADFVGGLMTRRFPVVKVMVVGQFAGLVLMTLLVVVTGEPAPSGTALLAGVGAGLAGTIGLAALYQGLSIGPMGIVAPTASLSGVIPVLAGLVQGERPSAVQFAGISGTLRVRSPILALRYLMAMCSPSTTILAPQVGSSQRLFRPGLA